jgi:hypothetical protein
MPGHTYIAYFFLQIRIASGYQENNRYKKSIPCRLVNKILLSNGKYVVKCQSIDIHGRRYGSGGKK